MNAPHNPQVRQAKHLATFAALSLAALSQQASAADVTWLGNTSNLWNVGSNWSTSAVPANGDTLVFGVAGSSGLAITDNIANLTVGGLNSDGIRFGPAAGSYTLARTGSEILTLGSSGTGIGIKNTSLFLQTITAPIVLSGTQTIQVGEITGANLSSMTISGAITGGQRLVKTGTGLLNLGSSSNALGGLTVRGGVVSIGTDTQLSTTAPVSPVADWIVLDGGALRTNIAALTINANRGISVGNINSGSGGTILVSQGTTTYNGVIANNTVTASSLTKTGTGTLSLGGTNTYTGATIVNQGQLTLDFTAAGAPTANIVNSASNLTLGGISNLLNNTAAGNPIVLVQGGNTVATSQSFNGLVLNAGNSNIIARGGSGSSGVTVALGAITQNAGGTVGLSQLTGGSTGQGGFTTTTANTNGILGSGVTIAATVGTGTAPLAQTDWASNDGSGNIIAYTGYTTPTGAAPTLANSPSANVKITAGSTGNIGLTFASNISDLNTIQATDTVGRTITVGSGNTLRLGQFGGVWKASATNNTLTIGASGAQAGSLTAGGASDAAGSIVFNTNGAAATNQTIVINSAIVDNGAGAVSITKTGLASLVLNGTNTFSGGTFINQGVIIAGSLGAFGGSGKDVTVLSGGQVSLSNAGIYANNFKLSGSGLIITGAGTVGGTVTLLGDTTLSANSSTGTISGKVTGDFNLSTSQGIFTVSNVANDYSGNLGINGVSTLSGLANNAAGVKLGASNVLANGAGKGNVWLTTSSAQTGDVTLDLNGFNETINGLISGGNSSQWSKARVINTSGTASMLTLGDNDQTATFGGVISQTSGIISVTKIGAGIQTFGGINTYTGNTTVTGGTLTLALGGSTLFAVTDASSTQFLGTGAVNFNGSFSFDVSGVSISNGSWTLVDVTNLAETFNLTSITSTGGLTFTKAGNIWTSNDNMWSFNQATGILSVSAIPEPSAFAAIFGALALGTAALRRRRSN